MIVPGKTTLKLNTVIGGVVNANNKKYLENS